LILSLFAGGWTAHADRIEYNYDLRHRLVEGRYPARTNDTRNLTGNRMTPSVEMPHPAPTPSCPTSFTVNDNGDAGDATPADGACATGGAVCTLRAAIEEANALSSCGTIDINFSGVTSPINLGTELLAINHNVNLNGPGANLLTVQRSTAGGTPAFRIFTIQSSISVNISGLTVSRGSPPSGTSGGGISNSGTLMLTNSTVSGNSAIFSAAGGILNQGTLTLTSTTLSNNSASAGGCAGILNQGTLTMTNSTASGNTATGGGGSGGAICNSGALTLMDSSVSGNSASFGFGGGIENDSSTPAILINSTVSGNSAHIGGGINQNGMLLTLTNSTVSGNTASGAGNAAGGIFISGPSTLTLTNSTVCNNTVSASGSGGGISNNGSTVNLRNTIIANNTISSGSGPDLNGTFNSQDYNLIRNTSGASFSGTTTHNLTGVDPLLGPLANNGGSTQAHALLPGSPAIDAGNNCVLNNSCSPALPSAITTDQRGAAFNRSADGNGDGSATVDIGAYEVQSILVTNTADSGAGSLRQAISDANASPDSNAINFQIGLTGTVTLLTALPDLSTSMAINGPGANQLTVMRSMAGGTPDFRIFTIPQFGTASISGLTISNGRLAVNQAGGGVSNRGTLAMTECNVYGNNLNPVNFDAGGGGLFNAGSMTLNNCNIGGTAPGQGNGANGGGAGISEFGTMVMTGGSIVGNAGTGISVTNSLGGTTLINVNISNNVVFGGGGGVGASGAVTLINCLISNNSTVVGGGGINIEGANLLAVNTTISGNTTTQNGGGIRQANNGVIHLVNATITNNRSDSNNSGGERGGGIDNSFGTVFLANTIVASNYRGASPSTTADDINGVVDSSSAFNLIGTGGSGGLTNGVNNNQVGVGDAKLAPLTNNGGLTMTHALLSGSPAIDAGNNAAVTNPPFMGPPFTDQRGGSFNRIADGDGNSTAIVDIGAYELQGILTVDKVSPPAGRVSGGQQIVLAGAFANLSTVTMGGASASWFYTNGSLDTSMITVTTPAHAVGAVQIDLTPTSGSPYSKANAFAYLPTVFTDDTLMVGVTTAKAQHIVELRQAVDALRAVAGLTGAPWTDPALAPGDTIRAIHILDLRTYLDDAATRLGYSTSPYTDPSLSTGYSIKRIHVEDLRQRIRVIAG